jgi:hypothetical protein
VRARRGPSRLGPRSVLRPSARAPVCPRFPSTSETQCTSSQRDEGHLTRPIANSGGPCRAATGQSRPGASSVYRSERNQRLPMNRWNFLGRATSPRAPHFIPVRDVERFLDVMALHKFNRLQIHLTDDHGWPYIRTSWRPFPRRSDGRRTRGSWRRDRKPSLHWPPTRPFPGTKYRRSRLLPRDARIASNSSRCAPLTSPRIRWVSPPI